MLKVEETFKKMLICPIIFSSGNRSELRKLSSKIVSYSWFWPQQCHSYAWAWPCALLALTLPCWPELLDDLGSASVLWTFLAITEPLTEPGYGWTCLALLFLGYRRTALLANKVTILSLPCCYLLLRGSSPCAEQLTLAVTRHKAKNLRNALQGHSNCLDICPQHVWQVKLLREGM